MTHGSTQPTASIAEPDATAAGDQPVPVLRLANVTKRFGPVAALTDASFAVVPGEVHALLGENGAGKSTLMNVAAGSIAPDSGTITIAGEQLDAVTPAQARALGLAIVRQHPALMPDLTVAENLAVALPDLLRAKNGSGRAWMTEQLERAGCSARLSDRVEDLSVAQRQLLELAKALAQDPRVLVLDEPTAPLGADMVDHMLDLVRGAAARGTAVVYISHRLPEVRRVADRVTVMRDGTVQATSTLDALSDDQILELIVGRSVETAFPPKHPPEDTSTPVLVVEGLSGQAFADVDLRIAPGEIIGLAGIAGNGQAEFMRALAGLERASGSVTLNDRALRLGRPGAASSAGVAYLPSDRHEEGLMMSLSIRENASLGALSSFANRGVVRRGAEHRAVEHQRDDLRIRTDTIETPVSALSGGNQQKVVLARALLSDPKLILADEPTQGVDAGARIEIYRILREAAAAGIPVVVVSSDSLELEGLCDRILVFSRGQVVDELDGDDVTEAKMARSIVTATALRREQPGRGDADGTESRAARVRRFAKGDYAPAAILLILIVALGFYTWTENARVLSTFNITSMLTLLAALAFISFGQMMVILTGGIDLSVGPLAGLLVVVASFFVVDGKPVLAVIAGFAIMIAVAVATGALNGSLVRFAGFTPIAATLAMYIALQGVSLLLRPEQGGYISESVSSAIQTSVGPIPVAFLVAVLLALGLEYGLRRGRWGLGLRGAGSREEAAHAVGVRVRFTVIRAYVACSLLTFVGAVLLMAQLGIGDASQGTSYTLNCITAVVLGGASLFGGRGSFVGVLLGAFLIQQITNATTFLGLSQAWQYWFVGLLALLAAGIYTQARHAGR